MGHLRHDGGDPVPESGAGDDGVAARKRGAPEGDAVRVDAVGERGLRFLFRFFPPQR
jgi:hypothetical protein